MYIYIYMCIYHLFYYYYTLNKKLVKFFLHYIYTLFLWLDYNITNLITFKFFNIYEMQILFKY